MLFDDNKRYYIDRRLIERIAATESDSFQAYFAVLRADADHEIEHLINAFTVNETYFNREEHQLRCMTSDLLGNITREKKPGKSIRIWSIPCSTGEEPYSIAMWLMENWSHVDSYNIEIVGSDIDTRALKAAANGIYGERALMRLSRDVINRYFQPVANGEFQIDPGLRASIQFTRANLIDAQDMARYRDFDIVFCRNVLIYFDNSSRRIVAENLYDCLGAGGYICLGHSETMSRISPLFQRPPVRRCDRLSRAEGGPWLKSNRPPRGRERRILVVDDSSLVRLYYGDTLAKAGLPGRAGYQRHRSHGEGARQPFDLVIVDVDMPRMDGLSFLGTLRRSAPDIATLPALVITTEAGEQDVDAARAAGANFYLVKPVSQPTCGVTPPCSRERRRERPERTIHRRGAGADPSGD